MAFGREEKVDRLTCGIQRSIQVLVLAFNLDIGLVDPIALVRRFEMRSAAFVQLGCIGLHPAPNAAGIHLDTTFGHQFGDALVGERIPEIPAHAQNDHFSRVLAPFERIVQVDRHGILPYQDASSEVRNGTNLTIAGGPAIFDLESIATPIGLPACTFTTISGSCSTGTFVFTQQSPNQVAFSFTTNEIGYLGLSGTGFTPYRGIFTTQLTGGLAGFGCVVGGAQTCTDTIGNILILEATAAQPAAAGLGAIVQSGTIKATWSTT